MSDLPIYTDDIYTEAIHSKGRDALANDHLQSALGQASQRYATDRWPAVEAFAPWEAYRQRAHEIKQEAMDHLDVYLEQFVRKVEDSGARVHWAPTGKDACQIVLDIARRAGLTDVIKAKTMVGEEIGLNQELERHGIRSVETDLGEFIVQLAGERPSHILAPAIHKTRRDIADLFTAKLRAPGSDDPERLTQVARKALRKLLERAKFGVSGANFGIAESGTVVLVENEGNIRFCTTVPKIHVVLVGIEKIIPRTSDLAVFLRLLPRAANGQKLTCYLSFLNGPRRTGEDGPEQMHVILVDNGRIDTLADKKMREALYCIRCGACLNVCPVFRKIGGYSYGWVYSGPIGALVTPQFVGLERARELPFASSLCGACKDVCPVKINIPDLLLHLRGQVQETIAADTPADSPVAERWVMRFWVWVMKSPHRYAAASRLARWGQLLFARSGWIRGLPIFPLSAWTAGRDFPALAPQAFRDRWDSLRASDSAGRGRDAE